MLPLFVPEGDRKKSIVNEIVLCLCSCSQHGQWMAQLYFQASIQYESLTLPSECVSLNRPV